MLGQRWKAIVGTAAGVVVIAALWIFFAPEALGGGSSYVTTYGNSMAPRFKTGDLAVIRSSGSYGVGDVVLYHSDLLKREVLHRIIRIENGRYTLKGDNNPAQDPGSVGRDHLIGKLWFRVGGAGAWLSWLGSPLHAALFAKSATVKLKR